MERMLDPAELEPEPEPLARGAVAHDALSDVLAGLRRERGSARVTPASLSRALELLRAALDERLAERPLSAGAERLAPARRRLCADLERFLVSEAERDSPLEPTHLELGFGFAGDGGGANGRGEEADIESGQPELPALDLGDGRRLRGRIDRIDVDASGRAVVFDYKNKKVPLPSRWAADRNLQVPLYMRAAQELLGLDVVGGFYQPLSGESLKPRGVLDADSGIDLGCVRGDERAPEAVAEVVDDALATARAAASGCSSRRPKSPRASPWRSRRRTDRLRRPSRSRRSPGAPSHCCCQRAPAAARPPFSSSASCARSSRTGFRRARFSRSRSPSAPRASCASGCARAWQRSGSGAPRGKPRRRS
jgi:hypothetical protein